MIRRGGRPLQKLSTSVRRGALYRARFSGTVNLPRRTAPTEPCGRPRQPPLRESGDVMRTGKFGDVGARFIAPTSLSRMIRRGGRPLQGIWPGNPFSLQSNISTPVGARFIAPTFLDRIIRRGGQPSLSLAGGLGSRPYEKVEMSCVRENSGTGIHRGGL